MSAINLVDSNTSKVKININKNEIDVCPTDIPVISDTSMNIFKILCTDFSAKETHNLQAKVGTLINSIQKLKEAKSEDSRNKILTTLRSALTVALLVGGILGTIGMAWCPLAATGIGITTFIAYTALCYYNGDRIDLNISRYGYAEPFIMWIGGLFFPLYEGFGKVSRLEDQILTQQKEINDDNIVSLVSFFIHDCSKLKQTLTQEVNKLKESLAGLKQLLLRTLAGEKELQVQLERYEKALRELTGAESFYSQFKASI
jgi:hypothetical protein